MRAKQRAERDHIAQRRLVAATEKLTVALDLTADLVTAVQIQRGEPDVRAMLQREALANVLEEVAEKMVKYISKSSPPPKPQRSAGKKTGKKTQT